MKNLTRKLRLLESLGVIDPNDFYAVNLMAGKITFQGTYSHRKALRYTFAQSTSGIDDGMVKIKLGYNIEIVLT
jgi:hypothetical protein